MKLYTDEDLQVMLERVRKRVELKQASKINAYNDMRLLEKISDEIRSRNTK